MLSGSGDALPVRGLHAQPMRVQASADQVAKWRDMIRYVGRSRLDGRGTCLCRAKEQIEALLVGNYEPGLYRPSRTAQVSEEFGMVVQRL